MKRDSSVKMDYGSGHLTTSWKTGDTNLFRRSSECHRKPEKLHYVSENDKSLSSADSELVICDSVVLVAEVRDSDFHIGISICLYLSGAVGRDTVKKGI